MSSGRLVIAAIALTTVAGCGSGSGPNFIRLYNDTGGAVQIREITQSNSPSCYQPGFVPPHSRVLLTPTGECVVTAGVLKPGSVVTFSLGELDSTAAPPIVVVNGYGEQRCMVLPLPLLYRYGFNFDVSTIQPGGCD